MKSSRLILLIIGFLLFVTGFISFTLILIGGNLSYLAWIDRPGTPQGVIIRILMVGGGLVMAYMALNPAKESDNDDTVNPSR
ncbi:MAG: hypothetical protein IPP15_17090 [Saprospiraceae bacterium]|uniref:Uncharacterized protein n=1 Tax=Candidatus Opimibacter skivensis TaxID=2982028 RepID=A0A9D7XRH5_9BACT|nr:hypothetical protein [Candidatus Opimibacter skivensis]